jgi:hypothetical protein
LVLKGQNRMKKIAMGVSLLFLFTGASAFSAPVLSLSDDTLQFYAVHGSSMTKFDTVIVSNIGTGTASFTTQIISSGWLSATPASGSALSSQPGVAITIGANPSGKPATTLNGRVVFYSSGGESFAPETLFVKFTIVPATLSHISLSPDTLSFSALQNGSLPSSKSVTLSNTGGGIMNWQLLTPIPNWLGITPASGQAPPSVNLTVSVTRTDLPPGVYRDTIYFVSTTPADNSPKSLFITYTIISTQTALLSLSPDTFHFSAVEQGPSPAPQILEIRNDGTGGMTWSFGNGIPNWLSVSPPGPASAPTDVQLTALTGNLAPGTYNYYLKVHSNEAANSPDSVRITLAVASAQTAVISLTPDDTISFSASQGGNSTAPQTLQIRNTGAGDMTWSFGSGIPSWLSVIPPGPALAPTDVQLTAVPGSLVPGFYSHTLQVYSNQATNSPQAVVVNFLITEPPVPILQVSENILTFEATEGQADPPSQPLAIYNGGGGDLNWNLVSDQPWLFPANASGTNAGNLSVSVSIAGLSAGPHTGHLTITASGASGSPATVTVNLNIAPVLTPASLQISQSSLDFNAQKNQSIPSQFIDISNGGQLPLNWTATVLHAAPWLSINPLSGTDDGTITVSVTTDLNPLTYVDTIRIEAAGALNSPRFIPVRLNVTTDVGDEPGNRPRSFRLSQNYPNPFNPATRIDFALPRSGHAVLEVFNVVGQKIRTLVDGELPAGAHSAVWDGRTSSGQLVGSGIYFYRLKSHDFSDIKRAVFLK